jgi:GH24 family phage-related lysozyme (muramidase)
VRVPVRANWLAFTERFEGGVPSLYNDVRGMTTIAFGNKCDSPQEAAQLDLVHPDGTPATVAEKVAAWTKVHDDPFGALKGWTYSAKQTPLRLTRAGMEALALERLDINERVLRARVPDLDEHGACLQMALHSLAWAAGAHAYFPRLFEAVARRDYARYEERMDTGLIVRALARGCAAFEVHLNEWTPEGIHNRGLIPRNVANRVLMCNAQRVLDYHLDPDLLDWTHVLGVSDVDTQPELPAVNTPLPYIGNTPIMTENAASRPTTYPPRQLSEAETGSGGTIHPLRYPLDVDPDDEPA